MFVVPLSLCSRPGPETHTGPRGRDPPAFALMLPVCSSTMLFLVRREVRQWAASVTRGAALGASQRDLGTPCWNPKPRGLSTGPLQGGEGGDHHTAMQQCDESWGEPWGRV